MKSAEFTSVVRPAEEIETTSREEPAARSRPALAILGDARLRYALLLAIALFSAWLAFTIRSSINEIDAEVEMIRAKIVSNSN